MTHSEYAAKRDAILSRLENAVARDTQLRLTQHRSGRSPKSIHAEAAKELDSLFMEVVGEPSKGDSSGRYVLKLEIRSIIQPPEKSGGSDG